MLCINSYYILNLTKDMDEEVVVINEINQREATPQEFTFTSVHRYLSTWQSAS